MSEYCQACEKFYKFPLYKANNIDAFTWNENYNWANPAGLYPTSPYKHAGFSLDKLIPCCPRCEKPTYQSLSESANKEVET